MMDELITKKSAVSAFADLLVCKLKGERLPTWNDVYNAINDIPSAQPETNCSEIPNDSDTISRQEAIDVINHELRCGAVIDQCGLETAHDLIEELPSAQPEIIRCNSCKHWTQSTGKMKGYGLGRCDFHDADLVTCNGFCYWAERQNDG